MTRDEIIQALRGHEAEIKEADEWRPLADHVADLIEIAMIRHRDTQRKWCAAWCVMDTAIMLFRRKYEERPLVESRRTE